MAKKGKSKTGIDETRRRLIKTGVGGVAASAVPGALYGAMLSAGREERDMIVVDDFTRPDSPYHGHEWETYNPGYWKVEGGALRRRLRNFGDRPGEPVFPFHHTPDNPWPLTYDPSLPNGMIYRRDWKLKGNYAIRIEATMRAKRLSPGEGDDRRWKMFQDGYSLAGICFGARTMFDSSGFGGFVKFAGWLDDGKFGLFRSQGSFGWGEEGFVSPAVTHGGFTQFPLTSSAVREAPRVRPGERLVIELDVSGEHESTCDLTARLRTESGVVEVKAEGLDRQEFADGYFGIVARGLMDFEINKVALWPGKTKRLEIEINECHVCYALGDTLSNVGGEWRVRFLGLFRTPGGVAQLRVSDRDQPQGGWANVPVAAEAPVVGNDFRFHTAVLDAVLPFNPAERTLYYTIWKGGRDVTADPRIGTAAVGIGTGQVGTVPESGRYVGRLPRLRSPYRISAHGCHFIGSNDGELPEWQEGGGFQISDQPTFESFKRFEDHGFQVIVWDDDLWYLEEAFRPSSIDDAFKVVTLSISGPTTRWQMMRHWNVVNPGDHDYGMDDTEGPEQVAMRRRSDLGFDPNYLRRNFQMTAHLATGDEDPPATDNPKLWRRWKMPDRDFSLVIVDARLWRSSFETRLWTEHGWGGKVNVFDRHSPNRALLGEEQYAWLESIIRTDSSRSICVTGLNALHAVWTADGKRNDHQTMETPDIKGLANYVGWHAVPASRLLRLFGSREGIVSIYGDVHTACIMRNPKERLYECSFGPVGPVGGRRPKPGFGRTMTDYNGEPVEVLALYHDRYGSPDLTPPTPPKYWNFLDLTFDTEAADPQIALRVRNIIDGPDEKSRGGGEAVAVASETGRLPASLLPEVRTLARADVAFRREDGTPVQATRSMPDGSVTLGGFSTVAPGTRLIMTAYDGTRVDSQVIVTT